jgi:quinol-cytochrome oxidoreductase complex cytochrome b subunit
MTSLGHAVPAARNGVIIILRGEDAVVTMTVQTFFMAAVKILLAVLTIKLCAVTVQRLAARISDGAINRHSYEVNCLRW